MQKKPLGRTQRIALGALVAPFVVASAALFRDKATFAEWSGFLQFFFPSIVVPLLVTGLGTKYLGARKAGTLPPEAKP